jgi:hypothetical protein
VPLATKVQELLTSSHVLVMSDVTNMTRCHKALVVLPLITVCSPPRQAAGCKTQQL